MKFCCTVAALQWLALAGCVADTTAVTAGETSAASLDDTGRCFAIGVRKTRSGKSIDVPQAELFRRSISQAIPPNLVGCAKSPAILLVDEEPFHAETTPVFPFQIQQDFGFIVLRMPFDWNDTGALAPSGLTYVPLAVESFDRLAKAIAVNVDEAVSIYDILERRSSFDAVLKQWQRLNPDDTIQGTASGIRGNNPLQVLVTARALYIDCDLSPAAPGCDCTRSGVQPVPNDADWSQAPIFPSCYDTPERLAPHHCLPVGSVALGMQWAFPAGGNKLRNFLAHAVPPALSQCALSGDFDSDGLFSQRFVHAEAVRSFDNAAGYALVPHGRDLAIRFLRHLQQLGHTEVSYLSMIPFESAMEQWPVTQANRRLYRMLPYQALGNRLKFFEGAAYVDCSFNPSATGCNGRVGPQPLPLDVDWRKLPSREDHYLARMTPAQREVWAPLLAGTFNHDDIAKEVGTASNNVARRIKYSLQRLGEILGIRFRTSAQLFAFIKGISFEDRAHTYLDRFTKDELTLLNVIVNGNSFQELEEGALEQNKSWAMVKLREKLRLPTSASHIELLTAAHEHAVSTRPIEDEITEWQVN